MGGVLDQCHALPEFQEDVVLRIAHQICLIGTQQSAADHIAADLHLQIQVSRLKPWGLVQDV